MIVKLLLDFEDFYEWEELEWDGEMWCLGKYRFTVDIIQSRPNLFSMEEERDLEPVWETGSFNRNRFWWFEDDDSPYD